MPNFPWMFRFCNCIFILQHSNVLLFYVGDKIFCFYKKSVFPFLMTLHFRGSWFKFFQILRGVAHKGGEGGGSNRFMIFFFLGGLSKKGGIQYIKVDLIPWRTLCNKPWYWNINVRANYEQSFVNQPIGHFWEFENEANQTFDKYPL